MKNTSEKLAPCTRCGSEQIVAKTWTENVPNLVGTTTVQYSIMVCTNEACQKEFDQNRLKEKEKRQQLQLQKEERTKNNAKKKA